MKDRTLLTFLLYISCFFSVSAQWYQCGVAPNPFYTMSSPDTGFYFWNEPVGNHGARYTLYRTSDCWASIDTIPGRSGQFGCCAAVYINYESADAGYLSHEDNGSAYFEKLDQNGSTLLNLGGVEPPVIDAHFVEEDYGYVVFKGVSSGLIVSALPSGNSARLDSLIQNVTKIWFANSRTGWIWGEDLLTSAPIVLESRDSARTWSPVTLPGGAHNLHFPDSLLGYIVGDSGKVWKSSDEGVTWTQLPSAGNSNLYTVWFNDSQNGWVAGAQGAIFHTNDGGINWQGQNGPSTGTFTQIRFRDSLHGFALSGTNVFKTETGGIVNREEKISPVIFQIFPNPSQGRVELEIPAEVSLFDLGVFNAKGQKVRHLTGNIPRRFDLGDLPDGLYFLSLQTSAGNLSKRLILNRNQ